MSLNRQQHRLPPIPPDQPARSAFAQPIREFASTPGTRSATLAARPPGQGAPEETFTEVTRDATGDRTPAPTGEPATAASAERWRDA